jgi:hypothetical protein
MGDQMMMQLEYIAKDVTLVNAIDWNMTHEDAVRLYLEWGNNWARGNYVIRSKQDVSFYFVINTWEAEPAIYLIRRNSEEAKELAKIRMPNPVGDRFMETIGWNRGVYSLTDEVKRWLMEILKSN